MIELINKALNTFTKEVKEENTYTPRVKIQSTIDEGEGMKTIERMQHVFHETKKI